MGRKPHPWSELKRDMRELCADTAPEMLKILKEIATNGKDDSVRIAAVREILDRGFGKAVAPVAVGVTSAKGGLEAFLAGLGADESEA